MKKLLYLILGSMLISFLLASCSASSSDNSGEYTRGYEDGYYEGQREKQEEWDSWWEEVYYQQEVLEREDVDKYVRYAYFMGLTQGYSARDNHLSFIPKENAKKEADPYEYIEDVFYEYYPGDTFYTDNVEEIMTNTYPELIN